MDTEDCDLRAVVGGATVKELRGVLLALEGRVVDLGKPPHVRMFAEPSVDARSLPVFSCVHLYCCM